MESVDQFLQRYVEAFETGKAEAVIALFVDSDDASVIGTGSDEFMRGGSQIAVLFGREAEIVGPYRVDFVWYRDIELEGATLIVGEAVICIQAHRHGIEPGPMRVRITLLLVPEEAQLKILHSHVSIAALGQEPGTGVPDPSIVRVEHFRRRT